jgi:hypothetical protein
MVKAWWFSSGYTLPYRDGRPIEIGTTHTVEGEVIPCKNGLHGSKRLLDAVGYAPGPIVWRVKQHGEIVTQGDKQASSKRTYLAGGVDISPVLREFARSCALDVIDQWDAPDVVVQYLETGDETLRDAAQSAAWYAAWSVAESAAWYAARSAAQSAQNKKLTKMVKGYLKKNGDVTNG